MLIIYEIYKTIIRSLTPIPSHYSVHIQRCLLRSNFNMGENSHNSNAIQFSIKLHCTAILHILLSSVNCHSQLVNCMPSSHLLSHYTRHFTYSCFYSEQHIDVRVIINQHLHSFTLLRK